MKQIQQVLVFSALVAPLVASGFDPVCPDGMILPPMNLQMLYAFDMVAFKEDIRVAARHQVGDLFAAVTEAFGETTQTALVTFVDKRWEQNNDPERTWCNRRELEFGTGNSADADAVMAAYGTGLYSDYNERDSQADVVYIALRRDGEYAWNQGDFGSNKKVNIRIITMATDQAAMYYNGSMIHAEKPMWSDAATESCDDVNYPTREQMQQAIGNLTTYFVFQTTGTYNTSVTGEYGAYPNSVALALDALPVPPSGTEIDIVHPTLDAIKDLLCEIVVFPCPEDVIPIPTTVCSCQILEDTIRKFSGTC